MRHVLLNIVARRLSVRPAIRRKLARDSASLLHRCVMSLCTIARKIRVCVRNKAQIDLEPHREDRPRNAAATRRQPKVADESNPHMNRSENRDQQIVEVSERNEISPEVQDWLNRVVLPILKKVIFNV